MATTMREIAAKAGVTVSTVSRALSNDPRISEDVRKQIVCIAEESNYRRKRPTGHISYVIDKDYFLLTSHFYNRVIEGAENRIRSGGYNFQFSSLDPSQFSPVNLNAKNLVGMIMTSSLRGNSVAEVKKLGIPLVLLDYYLPMEDIDSVLIDNIDGIIAGMSYLSSLGHRRIAYLSGDTKEVGDDRLMGYQRAVRMLGLDEEAELVMPSDLSIQGAFEAMRVFLAKTHELPTAVMAVNDIVAIGCMEAVKERKLRIPADISVLGFDDIDLADQVIPKLSTMHVDKSTLGSLAVDRLLQIIDGRRQGCIKLLLKPILCVRESTGPNVHLPHGSSGDP